MLCFLLPHFVSILLALFNHLIGNDLLIVSEFVGQFLEIVVARGETIFDITVPCAKLQLLGELWELLVEFVSFFKVFFIEFLPEMFVHLTLLHDLFVNFIF